MNQPSPHDMLEARLTAYAFDELSGDERAQVERLLAEDTPAAAAAAREIAQIRAAGAQLADELMRELGAGDVPALTAAQRAAISRAAAPSTTARSRSVLRWSMAAASAALAAMLMVVVLVPGGAPAPPPGTVAMINSAPTREEATGANRELAARSAEQQRALGADAKQAAMLRAQAVAQLDQPGGNDALAKKGGRAVAGEALERKRVETDAVAKVEKPLTDGRSAERAAPGGAHATFGSEQRARAGDGTGAALAAGAPQPAPAAPGAFAPASASLAAAAPPAAEPFPRGASTPPPPATPPPLAAAPPPAKPLAMKSLQQAPAQSAPNAGPAGGGARTQAAAPAAPEDEEIVAVADRERQVENGRAALKDAAKSADKVADAVGAGQNSAQAAAAAAEDGMSSTSRAAAVDVPLRFRTAGVATLRRCLDAGQLPPPALVQIEDLIDSVPVPLAPIPDQRRGPGLSIDAGPCPWQQDHQLVAIHFVMRRNMVSARPPLNLALLVDTAAEMGRDNRLAMVTAGMADLFRQLGGSDRVSLVTYDAQAHVIFDGNHGDDTAASLARIETLSATADLGAGHVAAGLALAEQALQRNRHAGSSDMMVLCAAALPPGDQAMAQAMQRLVAGGVGVQLMAVGNDHPADGAFEHLAAWGHGGFTYLATAADAAAALGGLSVPREVIARQAVAEITFNPAEIASYRFVGMAPLAARSSTDDLRGPAGELCVGQTVTLLIEVARPPQLAERRLAQGGQDGLADATMVSVRLRYLLADGRAGEPLSARLGLAAVSAQPEAVAAVAAAAELGLALRHPDDPRYRWRRMLENAKADNSKANAWHNSWLIDLILRAGALPGAHDGGR